MPKTIIVSNRLPVKIQENEGQYQLLPSEGGLATGLGSIYKQGDNVWIGWPGQAIDDDKKKQVAEQLKELSLVPVYLTTDDIEEYYEGFSNSVLWPVFHYYASTYTTYKPSNWEYYRLVNECFKDAVLSVAEPNDTIWIHDYQLLLLPELIRRERPDVSIGFFLHIPFPSHEMFRLIPWRAELLNGMLGADLVGFHTFDDVRHFLSSVSRILPTPISSNIITCQERYVVAEAFPMGIDDKKYEEMARSEDVALQIQQIKETFKETKIILSVDRLDYSKGILQRLQALELLLQDNPEYIGKITLYMVVVPSRDKVPQYMELRNQIDKKVGNINALYRTLDWAPVNYFYRSVPFETLASLYASADVCLVSPMRDGMNLVSKEYVASRVNDDGVLILSEMAGASRELIDAILVNPNNVIQVKDAIIQALNMPLEEQNTRMRQMRQIVSKFNVSHWVKIFMDRLDEVKFMQRSLQTRHVGGATQQSIINRYRNTNKRLIFLDYDGTLVDFKPNVNQATPDAELYEILNDLLADPANHLVLISGRKHENLGDWFGNTNIYLIAEHGAWFKQPGMEWHKVGGLSTNWKPEISDILEKYIDRTPGSFIEEKTYSLVWHYRKAQNGLGELRANELMNTLKFLATDKGLQLLPGDKVVEVKNMEINKGKAALTLVDESDYDFIMALGDDLTDEDTFKALPDSATTIKVGTGASAAKFFLRNPDEVRSLLKALAVSTTVNQE
ncbi:bifunctional alpha,alpha-trehalose-phosphate synthase (UDP-forming)/trehalose-phosphatase [Mucilaginibacter sp. Bleaf8]|uniref:bifunctional alpha,alpha-trehalose-phosphate synthase (UDP-forming)/trehalose-phosphatase n=1 Tax=Mucilaginibacter sp. Bleaf8 TaxID=2834430 RepID=UPI001BCE384B|nr:bifunctional alpha,alpha-trehalose-phosphate synthase (UDP-forming)/trehalose-phosphatase [Mucilaginibacter sp. Bleaf8]MBS7563107.1 bifunctional alpha,alpha-trehalose-phosphate synthase (UDP-forming)/trehalose-phosphatase [Mucilaginibacter sp. Bleaf8]